MSPDCRSWCRSRRSTTFPSSSRFRSASRATPRPGPTSRRCCARARRAPGATSTGASTALPARWPAWAWAAATRSRSWPPTRSSIWKPSWVACGPAPASCRCRPWRRPMRSRRCSMIATPRCCSCRNSIAALVEPYEERLGKLIEGGRIAYDFRRAGWRDFEEWLARGERRAVRGAARTSSTTSTSSTVPARPACPRASCTATSCATCWRSGSRLSTMAPTRSRSPRRRFTPTRRWSPCWPRSALAARPS